jgi:hypothetical protein
LPNVVFTVLLLLVDLDIFRSNGVIFGGILGNDHLDVLHDINLVVSLGCDGSHPSFSIVSKLVLTSSVPNNILPIFLDDIYHSF